MFSEDFEDAERSFPGTHSLSAAKLLYTFSANRHPDCEDDSSALQREEKSLIRGEFKYLVRTAAEKRSTSFWRDLR
jgi:hypothetical protein